MNIWESNIKLTIDLEEIVHNVHFLDLHIKIDDRITFETYRKPLCLYMFTPWLSCHPKSVHLGIVLTELCRLRRTNSCEHTFSKHRNILIEKLVARGFPKNRIMHACKQFLESVPSEQTEKKPIVPFKIQFSNGFERFPLAKVLNKFADLLGHHVDSFRFITCFVSRPNLFRLRYGRFIGVA
jgi:hypothetical protein